MFKDKHDDVSLDFLSRRQVGTRGVTDDPDKDEYDQEHYRAYGVLRKTGGALFMIDFVSRGGSHCSFPYAHLDRIEYDGTAIAIQFSDAIVTVRGYRLDDCHRQLVAHRVVFIAEADHATQLGGGDKAPIVTSVVFAPRREPGALIPATPRAASQAEMH
jgi:hypothetical protein